MLFFRHNIFFYLSILWFCILLAITYFSLRDHAIPTNYATLKNIMVENNIEIIRLDSKYFYFSDIHGKTYKIPIHMLITQTHDKTNNHNFILNLQLHTIPAFESKISTTLKLCLIVLIGLLGFIILFLLHNRRKIISLVSSNTSYSHNTKQENIKENTNTMQDMSVCIESTHSSIRFSDVAGIKEAKDDLLEIIDYLKNPKKYQDLGIYLPKGVLLIGPPGVGKTMIAKAIAGESGVPFFYQSGSSFVQIYVGVGAQRVRELFAKARINAPAIIFIDEIDAIGKARGADNHHEWESTLNELLTEMDGFGEQSGVIVIAATNQAEVLDHALLRSGRFDRRIYVDLPDIQEREEILKVHLKKRPHELNLCEVAKLCIGFSGANLASLINEAAINALRKGQNKITMQDITETTHKVLFGKKKQNALNVQEKYELAIYNAGKAISQYWLTKDFQKITLLDSSLETTKQYKIKEHSSKDELITTIKIALSGNLALEANNLAKSTIAKQDIQIAKYIAKQMCKEYGMANQLITNESDEAKILELALQEHKEFILHSKHHIEKIARILIEKEKINKEELQALLEHI